MPILFNAEDFSEDEAEDLLEEMEDALDAMNRFGHQLGTLGVADAGYCSENDPNPVDEVDF